MDSPYHPDYGIDPEYREEVLHALPYITVREAASLYNVSPSTIYKWRKDYADK